MRDTLWRVNWSQILKALNCPSKDFSILFCSQLIKCYHRNIWPYTEEAKETTLMSLQEGRSLETRVMRKRLTDSTQTPSRPQTASGSLSSSLPLPTVPPGPWENVVAKAQNAASLTGWRVAPPLIFLTGHVQRMDGRRALGKLFWRELDQNNCRPEKQETYFCHSLTFSETGWDPGM